MQRIKSKTLVLFLIILCLSSCYHNKNGNQALNEDANSTDTTGFASTFEQTHHYSQNYNFVVKADSLILLRQQPEERLYNMETDSKIGRAHV